MDEKVKEIDDIKNRVIRASEYLMDDEIYLSLGHTKFLLSLISEKEKRIEELNQRLDLEKLSYNGMELLLVRERERIKELEEKLIENKKEER